MTLAKSSSEYSIYYVAGRYLFNNWITDTSRGETLAFALLRDVRELGGRRIRNSFRVGRNRSCTKRFLSHSGTLTSRARLCVDLGNIGICRQRYTLAGGLRGFDRCP